MPPEQVSESKPIRILPGDFALWLKTILFTFEILLVTFIYSKISFNDSNLILANRAMADTAVIVVGFSFALSGICHFIKSAMHLFAYRKYLGLLGFAYIVVHSIISYVAFPISNVTAFVSALLALIIYTLMALISNHFVLHWISGSNWRKIMHMGYIAYVFTIIHFGLKAFPQWQIWITSGFLSLPPISIFLFIFGIFVFSLRFAVFLATRHPKVETVTGIV